MAKLMGTTVYFIDYSDKIVLSIGRGTWAIPDGKNAPMMSGFDEVLAQIEKERAWWKGMDASPEEYEHLSAENPKSRASRILVWCAVRGEFVIHTEHTIDDPPWHSWSDNHDPEWLVKHV